MKQSYKLPVRIFVVGTAIAITLVAVAFIFMNPPQCPVEKGACIVGANIGLGLMIMLAIGIEAMTFAITLAAVIANKLKRNRD